MVNMVVPIDSLFTKNRFVYGPMLLFLILYAPIGFLLFTIRLFISLQVCVASLVLPTGTLIRKFVLRILYTVMGVIVQEKDWHNKDDKCVIIVANHITPFDHLAISLVSPCVSASVYNLPTPLSYILCYKDFGASGGREVLKNNIQAYLNNDKPLPILLYPEEANTNGTVALMKYGSWALDFDSSILVLGLTVRRIPFLPISPTVLRGTWIADLFYLLFSPLTIYTIRYVGKMKKTEFETVDEFAVRVQKATASSLKLQVSPHTLSDKIEYIKRLSREDAPTLNPCLNPDILSMSLQVKEVLPYLPIDIIKRDINRTRNVDMTITNFLEGNIGEPFPSTLEDLSTSPHALPKSLNSSCTSPDLPLPAIQDPNTSAKILNLNTAAKSFAFTAHDRMLSLQERKANLIAAARQRYIQKHHLQLPANSC